jgi:hypothetical protein
LAPAQPFTARRFQECGRKATGATDIHLLFTWTWLAAADQHAPGPVVEKRPGRRVLSVEVIRNGEPSCRH